MFDGLVGQLKASGEFVTTVDISSRFKSKTVVLRSIDYAIILAKVLWHLILRRYDIAYVTTAQSKNGFMRDNVIISLFKLFKVKVVTHQYGANYKQLLDALGEVGKIKLIKMLNYCSAIIVEGQYMKDQYAFMEGYDKKVQVIPNGLPNVGKSIMQPKEYSEEEPFRMYYLSNLIWSKGYFDVLQAVDILINQYHKNVSCVFAGRFMTSVDDVKPGISNKDDFDRFVLERHLENAISYYPGMYGDDKDMMFSKSNVFLLPTYYINEGQPVSIIEAMAYGCVPIVTEYRHIPMMVTRENGCFVEPKKPEQIAQTVINLMSNAEEYSEKSKRCIRDYKDHFTFEKYATNVINVIKESL